MKQLSFILAVTALVANVNAACQGRSQDDCLPCHLMSISGVMMCMNDCLHNGCENPCETMSDGTCHDPTASCGSQTECESCMWDSAQEMCMDSDGHSHDHGDSSSHSHDHGDSSSHSHDHGDSSSHSHDHGDSSSHSHDHGDSSSHDHSNMSHDMHAGHGHGNHAMYFYAGNRVVYLFEDWVTDSDGEYAGAVIATLILSFVTAVVRPFAFKTSIPFVARAVLMTVIINMGYALMLLSMTMNVGIFFCVTMGMSAGWILTQFLAERNIEAKTTDKVEEKAQEEEAQRAPDCCH